MRVEREYGNRRKNKGTKEKKKKNINTMFASNIFMYYLLNGQSSRKRAIFTEERRRGSGKEDGEVPSD